MIKAKTKHKVCLYTFKYLPIFGDFIYVLFLALLIIGIRVNFSGFLVGTSLMGAIILIAASYAFEFCYLHRLFIMHGFAVTFCINYQAAIANGFGHYLTPLRWTLLISGILLFIHLAIKRGLPDDNCNNRYQSINRVNIK